VQVIHDRHIDGLFPRQTWLRLLSEVGFEPEIVPAEEHSDVEGVGELFLGRKSR
jgi:hypothetical protein